MNDFTHIKSDSTARYRRPWVSMEHLAGHSIGCLVDEGKKTYYKDERAPAGAFSYSVYMLLYDYHPMVNKGWMDWSFSVYELSA